MILTHAWFVWTSLFVLIGFVASRRDGLAMYHSQFPPIAWNSPPPTEAERAARKEAAVSFSEIWIPHWCYWIVSGQAIYWMICAARLAVGADVGAPFEWFAANIGWLVGGAVALAAVAGGGLWLWTREKVTPEPVEVLPELRHNSAPSLPAPEQTQANGWSTPRYDGQWDRP